MPHLHLETTADLPENADIPDILAALVEALSEQETVESDRVRAYHSLRSNWVVGDGAPEGFAHLTIAAFEGRPPEWRSAVSKAMMVVLQERFAMSLEAHEVSVTVEVRQMERSSYLRQV
jgi:5-carboxymethyl-2-hydroxymuconate isomerase